jgi:hypothetical protein
MPDLDQLREIGAQLRQPEFEELVVARRRRTRRARIAAASTLAVAAVAVVVGVLTATGQATRTDPPPVNPSPTGPPTPDESFRVPAGQQTIAADIGQGDVRAPDVLASVTSSQPEHRGASELSATVPDTRDEVSTYCRGPADLYYFLDIGDGGGEYGRCSPDADTTLAPGIDIGDMVVEDPVGAPQTVRMWIARPSAAFLRCLREGSGDCQLSDVPPTVEPDAEFGFEVYEHRSTLAFQLLDDAGNGEPYPLQALSTVDGTAWLVDRAVVAAPGAGRLAFELAASDHDRLVDVYTGLGRHLERCRDQHADELPDQVSTDHLVYQAAFDKVCGVDVRLVVDGTAVTPDKDPYARGHFQELGAELTRNTDHRVEVEIVRGDPRDIQYAVVVRTRTQIP